MRIQRKCLPQLRNIHQMSTLSHGPKIQIRESCLVDEELDLKISDLLPHQRISLIASTKDEKKQFWSHATFEADQHGCVDVSTTAPVAGSYEGIHPSGLIWSMSLVPWLSKGLRLAKLKATTPKVLEFSVFNETDDLLQCLKDPSNQLTSAQQSRWYKRDSVKRVHVEHPRIQGTLFLPEGSGPFPGVIDMFGGLIPIMESRAALLASRGIASVALSYAHREGLPDKLSQVDLSYFEDAVEWFSNLQEIRSDCVGVVGLCMGGQLATWMAANIPKIRAVVNINGMPADYPSWYYHGKRLEDSPNRFEEKDLYENDQGVVIRDAWKCVRLLQPWRHGAKMLTLVSGDDMMVRNEFHYSLHDNIPSDMKGNAQLEFYPRAGHLLEPPISPLHSAVGGLLSGLGFMPEKYLNHNLASGGYPEEHAFAQKDGWQKTLSFLLKHLV